MQEFTIFLAYAASIHYFLAYARIHYLWGTYGKLEMIKYVIICYLAYASIR